MRMKKRNKYANNEPSNRLNPLSFRHSITHLNIKLDFFIRCDSKYCDRVFHIK